MKLYSEDSSPFSAPVRATIYAKALDVEIAPPPGGLLSTKFSAINPLGTIPCLILDDGAPLPESAAIMEYLEDRFPVPALRPDGAEASAKMRLLQRIGELQILTPLAELNRRADHERNEIAAIWLTRLVRGLSALQAFISEERFAAGTRLTLADCEIAPALFMLPKVAALFDKPKLLSAYPKLERYAASVAEEPAISRVLAELAPSWS